MKYYILSISILCLSVSAAYSQAVDDNAATSSGQAHSIEITGTVRDETKEPVIGAVVRLRSMPGNAAVTDAAGHFSLSGVKAGDTLHVSFLEYEPSDIYLRAGKLYYDIILRGGTSKLDEVVVVGYATQRKVNLTGAVSSISSSVLADRPVTNAVNALAGLAPGMTVVNSGGNTPGYESQSIIVRGLGTLNNSAPLVVVDGMTGVAISDVNPQDIESVTVLKDASSSAIYGSRAANGVILITTRQGTESAPRLTYSGNISFETVAKRMNLVTDYADFMEIQNAGLTVNGQAPRFSAEKIAEWRNDGGRNPAIYPNTDWQDHIYRNPSVVQTHNLEVLGSSPSWSTFEIKELRISQLLFSYPCVNNA